MTFNHWVLTLKNTPIVLGTADRRYEACRLYNKYVEKGYKIEVWRGRPNGKSEFAVIDPNELEDGINKIKVSP